MPLSAAEFNQLVTEHSSALYRLAFRLVGNHTEAEDIVQETFRSVWKSRQSFQAERGTRAWLATILRRRVADSFRKSTLPFTFVEDGEDQFGSAGHDPTEQEFSDEVQHALGKLPEDLRETLLLVVVGELTHQEAADVLGVPLGTVLSRVSRARKRMREYLASEVAKEPKEP